MNAYESLNDRVIEIDTLLSLMPEIPGTRNVEQIRTLGRASCILLCSHFEGFLQELMDEFVEKFNELDLFYKDIPVEIYIQNKYLKVQNYPKTCDKMKSFLQEYSVLVNGEVKIKLDSKSFDKTDGNPTPDVVERMFANIGVENIIDILNNQKLGLSPRNTRQQFLSDIEKRELSEMLRAPLIVDSVNTYLTEKRNTLKAERQVGFYNTISTLLKYRNDIAHGNKYIAVSPQDILQLKEKILLLSEGLYEKMVLRIEEISGGGQHTEEEMQSVTSA